MTAKMISRINIDLGMQLKRSEFHPKLLGMNMMMLGQATTIGTQLFYQSIKLKEAIACV